MKGTAGEVVRERSSWTEYRRLAPFGRLEALLWGWDEADTVLDLGCGSGYWLRRLTHTGLRPVGVEPDHDRTRAAARYAPVMVADGTRLPLRDGAVGAVWCLHVLHHLEDPRLALQEVRRVLRRGGQLLMAESVEDNPALRLARDLFPQWEGVPVRSRFDSATLAQMVTDAGLDVTEYRHHSPASFGALVLPLGGRWLWSGLQWLEQRLPSSVHRWGAYVDCVARVA